MLTTLAFALGLLACGDSGRGTSSAGLSGAIAGSGNLVTAYFPHHRNDRDNDSDHNDDDAYILTFGHAANAADRRESLTLIRRYYAAATAENGAEACRLLVPFVAESVVETYGHTPALSGGTCAVVMTKLFERNHEELVIKNATLKIPAVRIEGDKALVLLEFPTIPEVRKIVERRTGGVWRVLELLDGLVE